LLNFDFLVNKVIYLAPYNELTLCLKETLSDLGIEVKGFFDRDKKTKDVLTYDTCIYYDLIIINSPNYWCEISLNFNASKVFLYNKFPYEFIGLDDYRKYLRKGTSFDVLLLPLNKSNVIDLALVSAELEKAGISSAFIDIGGELYSNLNQGFDANPQVSRISRDLLPRIRRKATITSADWQESFVNEFIKEERRQGVITVGIVDGIEDFEDSDYINFRSAYQTVENVFVMGLDDVRFLGNKQKKIKVIGLPKLFALNQETISFPAEDIVVINVNFTYGSFEDQRNDWLDQVLAACNSLQLKYVITQHHADNGDLGNYNVSKASVYETIRKGTIIVSRFSTIILESLTMGKPVVYFNPHNEKVSLYKEPLGAFSLAETVKELIDKLRYELGLKACIRERAQVFLDKKCNIKCNIPPAKLAAIEIEKLIK
jgi:hypothetical protein